MVQYSPVMYIGEGADFVARRILLSEKPFIAIIEGIHGVGKSYFIRQMGQRLWGVKSGEVCKLHDFDHEDRAQFYEKTEPDYFLVENIDASHLVINKTIERHFQKRPDMEIRIVYDLSKILSPPKITLEKIMVRYNLVIENPNLPYLMGVDLLS